MSARPVILNLGIVVAYIASGWVGLQVAVPPGNAAGVWPAAGFALAALVLYGNRIIPGLLLGSVAIQTISYLDTTSTGKILFSLAIGTVITVGVIVQAWVGAVFTRQIMARDKALLKERSILLFCLLAGPISCLIASTTGIATLWLVNILTTDDLTLAWLTWWIGDSMGVLIFSPIVFCLLSLPRDLWKPRLTSVALPLTILFLITFIAFRYSGYQEMQFVESEFEKNTVRYTDELRNRIDAHIEVTHELKEFFDTVDEVSPDSFATYAAPKLLRYSHIQALEWIPRISHAERALFEQTLGKPLTERIDNLGTRPAPSAEFYFPIHYMEPYAGNESALGFDISSNPLAYAAVQAACTTGMVSVSDPLNLIQDAAGKVGLVFYAPIYIDSISTQHDDCSQLDGVVASVLRLEDQMLNIKDGLQELMLTVAISHQDRVFYQESSDPGNPHSIPSRFRFEATYPFPVANQRWQLIFTPEPGFITLYSSWTVWLILAGGLSFAAVSGMGLLMLTGRSLQTENRIAERTSQLDAEVQERRYITNLLERENRYLEMISGNASMQEILDNITSSIDELVPGALPSILLLDTSGQNLSHISSRGLPVEYIDAIDGEAIGPRAGSCGTATYLNRQVIVSDIANDPLWEDYREIALEHNLKACWSTPITVADNKVLGSFALYFQECREPDHGSIELINRFAKIAAITILRKQSEEQLSYHASHDALTGLVNRHEFERRAETLLSGSRKGRGDHALYFMDLDQFKIVNDRCGHTAGDEMLRQLTSVLQNVVRKKDTLARLGGDEFGVLIEYCSLEDAYRIATSLRKAVQEYQFIWEGHTFRVGVSIGLVPITATDSNVTELLKDADAACYMAKELGRNRIHVYSHEDEDLAKRSGEMQWIARLQNALEEDRFSLYAQTIEPLDGSHSRHYEILLRMIDRDGETISPGVFLPAAERYNLVTKLDYWVITHAVDLLSANPGFLREIDFCSINLSGQSISSQEILDSIVKRLEDWDSGKGKLCFEITETAAIANLSHAITFISTLKELGCRFALDDFGSGLSSFGYLKNLPVDYLKIDGMFIKNITTDPIDHAMVKSINEIGHVMGMKTIAEFVEDKTTREMLQDIGVDFVQGYDIDRPQPLTDLLGVNNP